jgi:hypothetical protein
VSDPIILKNMRKIFYFICFFSFLSAKACKPINAVNVSAYYKIIEEAESHIIDYDYAMASKKYEKGYELNHSMFGIDVYNALLCNVYLKNWIGCEFWASKLIDKGVETDFFNSKVFNELKKTNEWGNIKNLFLRRKSKINIDLKRQLDSLVIEDQKVYCSIPTGEISYYEAKENTISVEEKFSHLIEKYGYPTEEKVGLRVINDTLLSFIPPFDVLIRHGYQSNNTKLLNFFNSSLNSGEMDLRVKISNSDDSENFIVYKGVLYKLKSKYMDEDLANERKLKFINSNRHKGFLIYAKYSIVGSFADSQDVDEYFKMYDLFIAEWKVDN